MRFGIYLRELARLRVSLAISVLAAALAALWSVANVGLLPPRLTLRSLQMATAYTQVMVDTPKSALFDLRQNTDDIRYMTNRALLIGSLMASPPVRAYIARRAGVPAETLQVQGPRTPTQPRVSAVPGRSNGPTDIFRTTAQYRLEIAADPVAPFLDIYAQGPTASAARALANGAVDGLGDYVRSLAASQRTPQDLRVQIRQLGRARGEVINQGIDLQIALLSFFIVFAGACAAATALARVRRGYRLAAASA